MSTKLDRSIMKLCNVSYLLALSCFCCLRGVTSLCETRTLHITGDDKMELYIDGIQKTPLPNANSWGTADSVVLPCKTNVIAVKGTNQVTYSGILASTDDGFIRTNSSWKCTTFFYKGWELVGFDDSSWPSAYVAAIHQTSPWKLVQGIRTDAYWIWTPKYIDGDLVVYCRKGLVPVPSIPSSPCPSRNLTITVDDIMRLYIDGTEKTGLANYNGWGKADTVELPWSARVIAVQGTNQVTYSGILASSDDGFIRTNPSWKCTNVFYRGWQLVGFNDSSWPSAYVVAIHQTSPWHLIQGIRSDAYWIWTPKYNSGDLVVYCRKSIAPCIPSVPSIPSLPSIPRCPTRKLTITVDDIMRLYIDGTEKTGLVHYNDWTKADTVELPWTTRVIAVKGTDLHVVGGILASSDDGSIMTNSSWKCTNVYYKGWELVGFNDSFWPAAYVIAIHRTPPWTLVTNLVPWISTDAYWIWTPKYTGGDLVVYCRKNLEVPKKCPYEQK